MGNEALLGRLTTSALDALAIGVIVTDCQAKIVYANTAGHRVLGAPNSAIRPVAGKICTPRPSIQQDLRSLIAHTCERGATARAVGDYILIPAAHEDGSDLALCVLSVETEGGEHRAANAMLLVRAIDADCNLEVEGQRLFGLTRSEAKFASSLASGLSLLEAAEVHDVSVATARSHMKSIFRKTGAKRQSQVAALLRGIQMPVESRSWAALPGRS